MPNRTTGKQRESQVGIPPAVKAQLVQYQADLKRYYNREATYGEIIGGLLWGIPLWQAEAVLAGRRPQYERSIDTAALQSESGTDDAAGGSP